jgi:hypothetical protein
MTTAIAPAEPVAAASPPFPSLSALRSVHNDLLKRQHEGGTSPELLAAAEELVRRGRETGALLDAPDDRWSAQSALDYWAAALYRVDRREVDSTLAELDPELAPELDDALCPYVGLEAFREIQHEVFFGRSRLLADLTARLAEGRLLAVLGPSGSGKSSVVLGGLLPALKAGALPGSESWLYPSPLVPGSEPLRNLARAFLPSGAGAEAWVAGQSERLARDPEHLARLAAERGGGAPAVLVVDQFEEAFTLCEDNRVRQAFIAGLLALVRTAAPQHPQHRVVLTMRSDYEAFVTRLPDLQPFWEVGQLRVTPLSAAELREAIEKPAERVGLKLEEGVVPALLEDLLGEPAGLPLLQFTLLKLWEKREKNRVTWAAYRRLGGGRKALAKCADELYESLMFEDQQRAKRILLRMVRPDSGMEFTSSRVRRASLDQIGDDSGAIDRVLDRLVKARLVRLTPGETPGDAQVEVAHEALVRNWPALVDWLQEARTKIATRRRLEAWAADWVRLGRGHGGLLDEVQLAEAEAWLASPEAAELGHDEQLTALVRASREAVDRTHRGRRWKTILLWGLPLLLALYAIAWGLFLRELKRSEALQNAQVEVRTVKKELERLQADQASLAEKNKLAGAQLSKATAAVRRAQQTQSKAEADQRRATEQTRQAEQRLQEAERDKREAAQEVKDAHERAREAAARAEAAEQRARAELAQAEQALRVAQEKQSHALQLQKQASVTESRTAALETRTKNAEQRWKNLERELVDGGDEKRNLTIPNLLKRIQDTVKKRVELREFRKRQRPLVAGASVQSQEKKSLTGTICCLVRDAEGEYLLSRASVLAGPAGTPILQPSRDDGPLAPSRNVVADVVRTGANPNRAAAIARLRHGISINPQIPQVGRIEGIAENLAVGSKVVLVGRGSGRREGEIRRIDEDGTIITNIRPSPGDAGAPLLTPDHRLIGMLWGWSGPGRESYFAPIRPILDELKVELVTDER